MELYWSRIEDLDQAPHPRVLEALAHGAARLENPGRQLGLRVGVDRAAQPQLVDVAVEPNHAERAHGGGRDLLRILDSGRGVVDPVGLAVVRRVAGTPRLQPLARMDRRSGPVTLDLAQGPVLETEQQIVGDRPGEDLGRIAYVGHPAAGNQFGELLNFPIADQHASRVRSDQVGEHQGELLLAAPGRADDGDVGGQLHAEGRAIENRRRRPRRRGRGSPHAARPPARWAPDPQPAALRAASRAGRTAPRPGRT